MEKMVVCDTIHSVKGLLRYITHGDMDARNITHGEKWPPAMFPMGKKYWLNKELTVYETA